MKNLTALMILIAGCAASEKDPLPLEVSGRSPAPQKIVPHQDPVGALALEQAFSIAEHRHPELSLMRARVKAAEGRAIQAGLYPNPELVVRMEVAPIYGGTTSEAEYVAGVSQRLPMGERLGAAVRVEELERDRILKEWEVRRLEIRSRVQGSFAAALYMEEAVKLQSEIFLWSESAVAIARKRLEAGDALPEEVARAEMEQLRAGLEVERAKSVREGSLVALAAAMGESGMRIESVSGALEVTLEIPSLEIILSNLARSLFVEAAEAEVRLERAREKSVRAQRIPDINLDLFYRRQEATRTDAFDAGIGVALPLFDRSQGRLQEAGAVVVAAESRARSIRSESERQLREACLKLTRTMSQAHFLKNDIFPRIDTVVRAAERRYAGGDLSLSEILPIRRDRTSARLTCLESLRDVLEAWASLKPFISGAYQ